MSHVSEYVARVQGVAGRYGSAMPEHQRLVYAVELVVASVLPSAHLSVHEAQTAPPLR